jgi:hypothetical protein
MPALTGAQLLVGELGSFLFFNSLPEIFAYSGIKAGAFEVSDACEVYFPMNWPALFSNLRNSLQSESPL